MNDGEKRKKINRSLCSQARIPIGNQMGGGRGGSGGRGVKKTKTLIFQLIKKKKMFFYAMPLSVYHSKCVTRFKE